MDTRRPTTNATKPFSRNNNFKKDGKRSFGERQFQGRDNRPQPRDNRFQDKDNRFQKRDGRFPPRDNRFQPRGRFAPNGKNLKPWEKINKVRIVSDMQITDGKHRGKYVQSMASPKMHLTSRRIRETMFKILFRRVRAGRFLDLCAGSGMVLRSARRRRRRIPAPAASPRCRAA